MPRNPSVLPPSHHSRVHLSLDEAYAALHLTPLAEFVSDRLAKHPDEEWSLGATTWLAVEATRLVLSGRTVLVVGRNAQDAKQITDIIHDYIAMLGGIGTRVIGSRHYYNSGGSLASQGERGADRVVRGKSDWVVLWDRNFEKQITSFNAEPHEQICTIRWDEAAKQWDAFDATETLVMSLPMDGAKALCAKKPFSIRIIGPPVE